MKKFALIAVAAATIATGACSKKAQEQTAAAANTMATDTVNAADNAAAKLKHATGEAMTDTGNAMKATGEKVKH